jgi:hypothetical protein
MELTTKIVAKKLGVGRPRLSQIVKDLKKYLGPIKTVGNNQVFTPEQVQIMRNRNKTPGPQGKKQKGK